MSSVLFRLCATGCVGLLLVLVTCGCQNGKYKIVPVEGKISFTDGKSLPAGTRLIFNPGEGGIGTATAVTAPDGSFKVAHVSGGTGAEIGKYSVQLAAPEGDTGSFFKIIPREYCDGGLLHAEVKEGMAPLDFKVKKR